MCVCVCVLRVGWVCSGQVRGSQGRSCREEELGLEPGPLGPLKALCPSGAQPGKVTLLLGPSAPYVKFENGRS